MGYKLMLNELIFFISILVVSGATIIALRLGKEALVALLCLQTVLVNIFVTKHITLFGFTATATDALAVGATLTLNVLQEYYQKAAARHAIWISVFCSLFYLLINTLNLSYIPAPTDISAQAYQLLFAPVPRIIIASLVVYIVVQYLESFLYAFFNQLLSGKYFVFRNYASLTISQLLDTILFSFLGLYGINESFNDLGTLFDIIIISYIIKLLVIMLAVPFVRITKVFVHPSQSL